MSGPPPKVLIIAGPTASGKSARALEIAAQRGGVVINADSMQVYGALPLLTAQPSAEDRAAAPHRLYGVLPPGDKCSAPRWRDLALREIEAAAAEGKLPIIVGGTGFYIMALTAGLSPIPGVPESVRAETERLQAALGNPAFHAELAKRDPVMAARLHPNDTQRLIRAWEVLEATGISLAEWQKQPPAPPPRYDFETALVMPERDELYERCNARFDAMVAAGALDEARAFDGLIRGGSVPADAAVTHALGFRPLQACLRGELPLPEAVEKAKAETRQYAKRQVTWFRNQKIA